jgi:hypothetical protein
MATWFLQGTDGQEYTVEGTTPLNAAMNLKSKVEALSGYSDSALSGMLTEVYDEEFNEIGHKSECGCMTCHNYYH